MSIEGFNHKTACTCGLEHEILKTGVWVVEMADFGPYKLWSADLRGCAKGHTVLAGFGDGPIAGYYEPGFVALLAHAVESRTEGVDLFYVR